MKNKNIKILKDMIEFQDGTTWLPALEKNEVKAILNAIKSIEKIEKLKREINTLKIDAERDTRYIKQLKKCNENLKQKLNKIKLILKKLK